MGACFGKADSGSSASDIPVQVSDGASGSFEATYKLGQKLGEGTFSIVREGTHIPTGKKFAIKCVKKTGLTDEDKDALQVEIKILQELRHPNIMSLVDHFEEPTMYYLVTELLEGGELFDRIVEKEFYTEKEARDLVKILLSAIKFIHDRNIVHRDLKPENLLLTSKSDNANIKIADFGFAKQLNYDGELGLSTACGTPGYVAPEILQGQKYGKTVDVWSVGVITYILLCGYPPFHHENHNMLFKMIKKGAFEFDSPYWDEVSPEAKDLISKMLVVDTAKRWNCDQLLAHPWVVSTVVSNKQLGSAMAELKKFNARRKFKGAVQTVKIINRMNKMMGGQPLPPGGRESPVISS